MPPVAFDVSSVAASVCPPSPPPPASAADTAPAKPFESMLDDSVQTSSDSAPPPAAQAETTDRSEADAPAKTDGQPVEGKAADAKGKHGKPAKADTTASALATDAAAKLVAATPAAKIVTATATTAGDTIKPTGTKACNGKPSDSKTTDSKSASKSAGPDSVSAAAALDIVADTIPTQAGNAVAALVTTADAATTPTPETTDAAAIVVAVAVGKQPIAVAPDVAGKASDDAKPPSTAKTAEDPKAQAKQPTTTVQDVPGPQVAEGNSDHKPHVFRPRDEQPTALRPATDAPAATGTAADTAVTKPASDAPPATSGAPANQTVAQADAMPAPQGVAPPAPQANAVPAPQTAAAPLPQAAAVPIAGVAIEIAGKALAGKNRFEIRLDPPELGRIDVRLDVDKNGQVTSRLTVDRAETLDLLRRDAAGLERALQDAGLKTSDNGLQFSLRDQSMGRDQTNTPIPGAAQMVVEDDSLSTAASTSRRYARHAGMGSGIDIRV